MDPLQDLEQRLSSIMKNEKITYSMGDVLRITHLKPTQIHYWEHKGYIKPIQSAKNSPHLYNHTTLIKIEMIRSYLKSGFTLSVANAKASRGYRYGNLIRDVILHRFKGLTKVDGNLALDFGQLSGNPQRRLFFVIDSAHHRVYTKIQSRN